MVAAVQCCRRCEIGSWLFKKNLKILYLLGFLFIFIV